MKASSTTKKRLHRVHADRKRDWDGLKPKQMNPFQRVAAKTYGIVTPGNVVTAIGFFLVITGLFAFVNNDQITGTAMILLGRLCDMVDGIVADMTKTKSFVGATIDESADMILLGSAFLILVTNDYMPLLAAVAVTIPKSINALSSLSAKIRRKRLYPTEASKIGTAVIWTGVGSFLLNQLLSDFVANVFSTIGWSAVVIALVLTVPSTFYYVSIGFGSRIQSD